MQGSFEEPSPQINNFDDAIQQQGFQAEPAICQMSPLFKSVLTTANQQILTIVNIQLNALRLGMVICPHFDHHLCERAWCNFKWHTFGRRLLVTCACES